MMRCLRYLFVLIVVGCAPVQVYYDFEKSTDFKKYKTYNYYTEMESGLSYFDQQRMLDAIDSNMLKKGLALSSNPDFFVNIRSEEGANQQLGSVGVGVAGTGGNVGGGVSVGIPMGSAQGSRRIVFEFIDENAKKLIWEAVTITSLRIEGTPNEREASIKTICDKVLEGFPPNQ